MGRPAIFAMYLSFLTGFAKGQNQKMEQDVIFVEYNKCFDNNNNLIKNRKAIEPIRFSRYFWDFFIDKFPVSTTMIFRLRLPQVVNGSYLNIKDTSLAYFYIDTQAQQFFSKTLPTDPNADENITPLFDTDTFGPSAKNNAKSICKKLANPDFSRIVFDEFFVLRNILTGKSPDKHYVVIFKNRFFKKVFQEQ